MVERLVRRVKKGRWVDVMVLCGCNYIDVWLREKILKICWHILPVSFIVVKKNTIKNRNKWR